MKLTSRQQVKTLGLVLSLCVIALLCLGAFSTAMASSKKIDRQVRIFEKSMDIMLVDSPNWLVQNSEPTYGNYIDDYGVVFSFRASLVSRWYGKKSFWHWFDGDDDDDEDSRYYGKEMKRQARRYERGKEEIVETMMDLGDIFTTLGDNDILEIKVKLREAEYFDENDMRKLKMTVRMGDLRAYTDDRLSEDQIIDKIEIEED